MSKIPIPKPTRPAIKPNPWLLGNLPHLHAKIISFAMPTFVNGRWRPAKWNGRKLRFFRYKMEERGIPWPEIPRTWHPNPPPTRDYNIKVGKETKEVRGRDTRWLKIKENLEKMPKQVEDFRRERRLTKHKTLKPSDLISADKTRMTPIELINQMTTDKVQFEMVKERRQQVHRLVRQRRALMYQAKKNEFLWTTKPFPGHTIPPKELVEQMKQKQQLLKLQKAQKAQESKKSKKKKK